MLQNGATGKKTGRFPEDSVPRCSLTGPVIVGSASKIAHLILGAEDQNLSCSAP